MNVDFDSERRAQHLIRTLQEPALAAPMHLDTQAAP
jgi:hypothetical protein